MGCPIRDHCREDCNECTEQLMLERMERYNDQIFEQMKEEKLHTYLGKKEKGGEKR